MRIILTALSCFLICNGCERVLTGPTLGIPRAQVQNMVLETAYDQKDAAAGIYSGYDDGGDTFFYIAVIEINDDTADVLYGTFRDISMSGVIPVTATYMFDRGIGHLTWSFRGQEFRAKLLGTSMELTADTWRGHVRLQHCRPHVRACDFRDLREAG